MIENILSRLKGVKKTPRGWLASCPAHDDRAPSLSVTETAKGDVLLHCFAGCTCREICDSLGINQAELFHDYEAPREFKNRKEKAPYFTKKQLDELETQIYFCAIFKSDIDNGRPVSHRDSELFRRSYANLKAQFKPLILSKNYKTALQVMTITDLFEEAH